MRLGLLIPLVLFQVCWEAPTENVDGSVLTDLAGYTIYYGTSSRNYQSRVTNVSALATCSNVRAASGLWYVAMTALDSEGNESSYSNEVTKIESRLGGPGGGEVLQGPSGGRVITGENNGS